MGAQLHVYAAVAEAVEQADWADAALPALAAPVAASTTIASAALGPSTPDTADVWNDAPVMDLLRLGAQPDSLSREERQRVQRRTASYRWTGEQLIRLMPDGNTRVCPPPEARDAIVQQTHEIGHLGERRTLALCQLGYWWAGQRATVQGVVQRCKLCDMANTGGMVRPVQLRRHAPAAAGNLLIAQHRDTQRYALTHSGGYRARALEFVPGDYVYLCNANPDNTLEMPVRDQVLRVEHVGDMGVAALVGRDTACLRARVEQLVPCHLPNLDPIQDARLLRTSNDLECEVCRSPQQPSRMLLCDGCGTGWHLRCLTPPLSKVPPGAWMCPGCVELGKAPPTGPAPQRPSAGPVLFPNADTRRRDAEAATLDGVSVVRAVPGPAGTPRQLQNGTLRFRGPLSRPFYFMVEWPGGSAEAITLADAKRLQRQTVPSSPASAPAQGGEPTAKRRVQPFLFEESSLQG